MTSNSKNYAERQGRTIRCWRLKKKLTQQELADTIEMPRPVLSHIETGKVFATDETLLKLSRALECFIGDIDIEAVEIIESRK